jgi:hypothetical protein
MIQTAGGISIIFVTTVWLLKHIHESSQADIAALKVRTAVIPSERKAQK